MNDAVAVQVMQRADQLLGDGAHLLLRKALVILQNLEQLPLRKLRDDAELRFRLERVHHGDDVLVFQPA